MAHRKFIDLPMKDGDFLVRKLLVYQRVFVHESFGRVNPPSLWGDEALMNETALAIDSGTAAGLALKTRGTGDENNGGALPNHFPWLNNGYFEPVLIKPLPVIGPFHWYPWKMENIDTWKTKEPKKTWFSHVML